MLQKPTSIRRLLDDEAGAFRDLAPADYQRAAAALFDRVAESPPSGARTRAVAALASVVLRRPGPVRAALRVCAAEHLLSGRAETAEPALRRSIDVLFLLAWLQLGAIAERGPATIAVSPALPFGVLLPFGADPAHIANPKLREEARALARAHREEVERWNEKQHALQEMHSLVFILRILEPAAGADAEATKVLAAAMALAPGVPPALRETLEELVGE